MKKEIAQVLDNLKISLRENDLVFESFDGNQPVYLIINNGKDTIIRNNRIVNYSMYKQLLHWKQVYGPDTEMLDIDNIVDAFQKELIASKEGKIDMETVFYRLNDAQDEMHYVIKSKEGTLYTYNGRYIEKPNQDSISLLKYKLLFDNQQIMRIKTMKPKYETYINGKRYIREEGSQTIVDPATGEDFMYSLTSIYEWKDIDGNNKHISKINGDIIKELHEYIQTTKNLLPVMSELKNMINNISRDILYSTDSVRGFPVYFLINDKVAVVDGLMSRIEDRITSSLDRRNTKEIFDNNNMKTIIVDGDNITINGAALESNKAKQLLNLINLLGV